MTALRVLISRLQGLFRKSGPDARLSEEIETHLALLTEERMRAGMSHEDARASARAAFGGVEQVKETYRDQRGLPFFETLAQDVRYGWRVIGRSPGFAVISVLILAVGIGATTAIFTIANALLFRVAPGVTQPDRLVEIVRTEGDDGGLVLSSYPDYADLRDRVTRVDDLYAYQLELTPVSLRDGAAAERIFAGSVSVNFFEALGIIPAAGGLFNSSDTEHDGADPKVVLSHHFWVRRFNADRAVIGRTVQLNGHPFVVIGVASEQFRGLSVVSADVWVPTSMVGVTRRGLSLSARESRWLMLGGRLPPGLSAAEANAELDAIIGTIAREQERTSSRPRLSVAPSTPIPAPLRHLAAGFFALMMGLVLIVLAIVRTNVAGVLLARAIARSTEMAVRVAIGAGRMRLIRQLLTETTLLFTAGAIGGLVFARGTTALLPRLLPAFPLPVDSSLPLDGRVVAFALALSLVALIDCRASLPLWRRRRRMWSRASKTHRTGGHNAPACETPSSSGRLPSVSCSSSALDYWCARLDM